MKASGAYNFPIKEFIVREPMQIFSKLQSFRKYLVPQSSYDGNLRFFPGKLVIESTFSTIPFILPFTKIELWHVFLRIFQTFLTEAAVPRCSSKEVFLKVSQYSQKNIWRPVTLLKRNSNTGVFLWILRNVSE